MTRNQCVVALVALTLTLQASTFGQTATPAPDVATGVRQIEEGDLDAAVTTLDAVVQRLSSDKARSKDLAQARLYLAMAYLGLDQFDKAKAEMREATKNDPSLKPDPKNFPPRVIGLFEEAKAEARAMAAAQPPPTTTASSGSPSGAKAPPADTSKGGGGKVLLIVGGLALVGGGLAVAAGGGGEANPAPAPTRAAPQILLLANNPPFGSRVSITTTTLSLQFSVTSPRDTSAGFVVYLRRPGSQQVCGVTGGNPAPFVTGQAQTVDVSFGPGAYGWNRNLCPLPFQGIDINPQLRDANASVILETTIANQNYQFVE